MAKIASLGTHLKQAGSLSGLFDFVFDKNFNSTNPASRYTRGYLVFGQPLEGYSSPFDRQSEQDEKLAKWYRDEGLEKRVQEISDESDMWIFFVATPFFVDIFLDIIVQDMLKAFISCALVWAYLW